MIERPPQLCSTVTPRKEIAIKTTLGRRVIIETLYESEEGGSLYLMNANKSFNATLSMFLRLKQAREIFDYLQLQLNSNIVNCIIRIKNSTALLSAKSRNGIGTREIADFGPKDGQILRVISRVSVDRRAIINSKSAGKQETYPRKSSLFCLKSKVTSDLK